MKELVISGSLLSRATDDLNQLLFSAQKALQEMDLGIEAEVEMSGERRLAFTKSGPDWILEVREGAVTCPLLKARRVDRIAAAQTLARLETALRANARKMYEELAIATASARGWLYPTVPATESESKE